MKESSPVRLITIVWGDEYCDRIVNITLPSILAPGNLPTLVEKFSCELVIVTEKRLYERIDNSAAGLAVKKYCNIRYVAIDDLIEGNAGYGMSLTYALHRGFDDLGDAMKDYFLIFFNADFILADDSYRVLAEHMAAGEELIFAPSYCVNAGQVLPMLSAKKDQESSVIAFEKRDMARIALAYRHNTVRAKTINQQMFHMHVTDQFYWNIDQHTRLGRQLPIAIVCMKPQNVVTEPLCFWDYSTISLLCPTSNRCVLGDSDDFLMIELRDEGTFQELMTIGQTTPAEIAEGLGNYMTADQFEMGHYGLVLHDRDLPECYDSELAKFNAYMDDVYRRIPKEPVSYINHRFWLGQVRDHAAAVAEVRRVQVATRYRADLIAGVQSTPLSGETGATIVTVREDSKRAKNSFAKTLAGTLYLKLFGQVPRVTKWHPYWAELHTVVDRIDKAVAGKKPHSFILTQVNGPVSQIFDTIPGTYVKMTPLDFLKTNIPLDAGMFDLVFCDLNWVECVELPRYYHYLRMRIRPGGTMLIYTSAGELRGLQKNGVAVIVEFAPVFDTARFYFGGSLKSAVMLDRYKAVVGDTSLTPGSREYLIRHAKFMLKNAHRARLANLDAEKTPVHRISDMRTSMTIEIPVN